MRAPGVVVGGVNGKHLTQVPLAEGQHPVGGIAADGQDDAGTVSPMNIPSTARLGAAHRLHRSGLAAVNAATGPTESVPRIVEVMLGPPLVLLVEVLPGQSTVDGRPVAHRLAEPSMLSPCV